jgi:hypothetical protein
VEPSAVIIDYTNYRGRRRLRRVIPTGHKLHWGTTEHHPEPQWLLEAYDLDRKALRTFAVKDIHAWRPSGTTPLPTPEVIPGLAPAVSWGTAAVLAGIALAVPFGPWAFVGAAIAVAVVASCVEARRHLSDFELTDEDLEVPY